MLPFPDAAPSREEISARYQQRRDLLRRLDSKQAHVRRQAIDECRDFVASEIFALIPLADERKHPVRSLRTKWRIVLVFLLWLLLLPLLLFYMSIGSISIEIGIGYVVISMVFLMFSAVYAEERLYSARLQNSLATIVANTQDPAILPHAIRLLNRVQPAYYSDDTDMLPLTKAYYEKSVYFLEQLEVEQIRRYGIQQQALCLFLEASLRRKFPHAAIRVLNYLEQFGTSQALVQVAAITSPGLFKREASGVQRAAQSCLAALQQRARESNQMQTLLRASAAPAAAPDALLRPAAAQSASTETNTLLRSADPTQSSPPIPGKIINGNSNSS